MIIIFLTIMAGLMAIALGATAIIRPEDFTVPFLAGGLVAAGLLIVICGFNQLKAWVKPPASQPNDS